MTEDEAKAKWCPFARVSSGGGWNHRDDAPHPRETGWNRREGESFGHRQNIGGENHCIGSGCMAWRSTGEIRFRDARTGQLLDRDLTGHGQWVQADGFCGLAGKPS